MAGVFVNYRTGDGDWAAALVARELSSRFGADNVFLASKAIRLGEDFADTILTRLIASDVLLVVIGSRWLSPTDPHGGRRIDAPGDWVRREITEAFRHGLRVIPVLLDGVGPLAETDLPEGITALARRQYVRLHHRSDDRDIARLLDDLAGLVPALAPAAATASALPEDAVAECPYRGLQPFREADAAYFHGRDREITRLAQLIDHQPVVMVAGPSGSGKSSLVRAGLWPLLRERNVALAVFRPIVGIPAPTLLASALRPVLGAELAERLSTEDLPLLADPILEAVGELVLFVDQFEEIAAADPAAATDLLDSIATLLRAAPARPGRPPALRAVMTVRSADLDGVLTAELVHVLEEATVYVRRMGEAELRAAITEPAAATGLSFEPGLVERIVADAGDAPAQLPLVEFSLTRLWEARRGRRLTHQAYDEMGGVAGALATYAEELYSQRLPAPKREFVERLLVQLARPGEDGPFLLSPAPLEQLDPALRELAIELSATRLVVIRQDINQPEMVALAHEALVRSWQRLRDWLAAAREFRTWQEQLRVSLAQWQRSDHDPATLLRGPPLATAQHWLATHPVGLTAEERGYIVASREQDTAQRSRHIAELADQARATDPALAMQLSLTAYAFASTPESRASLHASAVTPFDVKLTGHTGAVRAVAYHPTGRILATSADDGVRLWDLTDPNHPAAAGTIAARIPAPVAFSSDGHLLAAGQLWNLTDVRRPTATAALAAEAQKISAVAVGAEARLLVATVTGSTVDIWDISDPRHPQVTASIPQQDPISAVAMSANGRLLAVADAGGIRLWDISNPHQPMSLSTLSERDSPLIAPVTGLALSPSSTFLAAVSAYELSWWDVSDPHRPVPQNPVWLGASGNDMRAVAFGPDPRNLAIAAQVKSGWQPGLKAPPSGVVLRCRIDSAEWRGGNAYATLVGEYPGRDGVESLAFSPDGTTIATGDTAGVVHLWSDPAPIFPSESFGNNPIFSSDSRTLIIPSMDTGDVRLIDVTEPNHPVEVSRLARRGDLALFFTTAHTLVAAGLDGVVGLWDLADPRRPAERATLARNICVPSEGPIGAGAYIDRSRDGHLLAHYDPHDHQIHIWDVTDPNNPVEASALPPTQLAFNAARQTLVGVVNDCIELWDVANPSHPTKAGVLPDTDTLIVDSAFFTEDLAGGHDNLITHNGDNFRLWDITDPYRPVAGAVLEHADAVTPAAGAVSPDGRIFAVADKHSWRIILWDVSDAHRPAAVATFVSGATAPRKLRFSPDGHRLVVVERHSDNAPRYHLWDVTDPTNPVDLTSIPAGFGKLSPDDGHLRFGEFSPDGRVAVVSGERGVYLLDLDTDRLARYLCDIAGSTISESQWRLYLPDLPYQPPCR